MGDLGCGYPHPRHNAEARYIGPDAGRWAEAMLAQRGIPGVRVLFEIIMRRYQVRSTIMTSNRPLEDWGKLIGDVPAATAILDRFLHNADVISITGKSYRMKDHAARKPAEPGTKKQACEPTAK